MKNIFVFCALYLLFSCNSSENLAEEARKDLGIEKGITKHSVTPYVQGIINDLKNNPGIEKVDVHINNPNDTVVHFIVPMAHHTSSLSGIAKKKVSALQKKPFGCIQRTSSTIFVRRRGAR